MPGPIYDFIIAGGGSAGCVLANRLSAERGNRVLVLEAGRPDYIWDPRIHMPSALSMPIGNPRFDWQYQSEPEPHMNGRRIYHARGKVLGGSSSINGMIFQRGNPLDYERWAADPGMENWSYAHCLPYFKRMETCLAGTDEFRGGDGPLALERGPARGPLFQAFFEAVQQAGYSLTKDVNGFRQEGFAPFDRNIRNGRRLSAARAYLHPIAGRPNLKVVCQATVAKILLEGKRAVGVEYLRGRSVHRALAKELIVCGGAFNSPHLLQLSGIGNPADLVNAGITPLHELRAVGANLQDHLEVYIQYACLQPVSRVPLLRKYHWPWIGYQWLFHRSGPGATNHFEAGGFIRGDDSNAYPNIMFHFLPLAVRYDGSGPSSGHGYQVHVGPMYSNSRGSVTVRSANPLEKPAIRFNYLSTQEDRREWIQCVRAARSILNQPAFASLNGGELSPGKGVKSDADVLDWVARDGETALHPASTCRMGSEENSVINPSTMGVHGVTGLRVVDASAAPYVTNGNLYAPVMMLAEKGADLILGNTPLAAETVPFYRHGM